MALDELNLSTPNKRAKVESMDFDDEMPIKLYIDAKEAKEDHEEVDQLRNRWVGQVDLPERTLSFTSARHVFQC